MTATPVAGPAPDPLTADPRYIDPVTLAKFDTLCSRMALVAEAVNAFDDPTLRERAFYELVGIINPSPDEPEPVDVVAVPRWGDAPASAVEIGRLATWICDSAPTAWRESIQPGQTTVDAATRFLQQGAAAWTQVLLVKHALMTQAGFTAEQVDGDLVPLIRELSADPPVSPEIEQLAGYLRGQAEPGESVAEVAIRLIERLRQGRPALVPSPEVERVADGLHPQPAQVDERGGEPEPQPGGIGAAIQAYKDRTGTS